MEIERTFKITMVEDEAQKIIKEIDELEVKFDKEYMGSPYDEITNLSILKRLLCGFKNVNS
jgi:hypothetical protein